MSIDTEAAPPTSVTGEEVLRAVQLRKEFTGPRGWPRPHGASVARAAVDGVDLVLRAGQTLGLVGESGCGKSTTGRMLARLVTPTSGRVFYRGSEIVGPDADSRNTPEARLQMVFQDPYSSLSGRMPASEIVSEPLRIRRLPVRRAHVLGLLESVGLGARHLEMYPHELSGGQRQRLGIARALALKPEILILDEPVSALDVSVQAQVVNQLSELQASHGLAYLFISHNLAVVRQVAEDVAVMYLGRIVETGSRDQVFASPRHPYTVALLSAVPHPDPRQRKGRERIILSGEMDSDATPRVGCRFRSRCWKATDLCVQVEPPLVDHGGGHMVACHHPEGESPQAGPNPASTVSTEEPR